MTLVTNFLTRKATTQVDELFISRWSPKAYDPNYTISQFTLDTLFEAARWSWSSSNLQPWRYIYGVRGTESFDKILSCLTGGNETWALRASCLVLVLANTVKPDGKPNTSALFDTGASVMNISIQARLLGIVDRHMGGMDRTKAKEMFGITDEYAIHCTIALGKQGDTDLLSEYNQSRETLTDRKPTEDLAKTVFDF